MNEILSALEGLGWTVEKGLADYNCYLKLNGLIAILDDSGVCIEDEEVVIDSFSVEGLTAKEINAKAREKMMSLRYEPSLGPNTNQWWVYDHETNEWVDPPTEILQQLGSRADTVEEVDRQSDILQQIVNENPDWLYDKDYRYNGDLEI